MKHNHLIICLLPLLMMTGIAGSLAQTPDTSGGKVVYEQDPRVDQLVEKHIQTNLDHNGIEGFRIQIFSDSGNNTKTRAQTVMDEFLLKYPETGAYLTFKSPNYKVRVGDFRSKLDAQSFLNELTVDYPNAFIVADKIRLPGNE